MSTRPTTSSTGERRLPKRGRRRPYKTPTLTEYGPVGKLTQSGMGTWIEGLMLQRRR